MLMQDSLGTNSHMAMLPMYVGMLPLTALFLCMGACLDECVQLGHILQLGVAVEQQRGVVAAGVALQGLRYQQWGAG